MTDLLPRLIRVNVDLLHLCVPHTGVSARSVGSMSIDCYKKRSTLLSGSWITRHNFPIQHLHGFLRLCLSKFDTILVPLWPAVLPQMPLGQKWHWTIFTRKVPALVMDTGMLFQLQFGWEHFFASATGEFCVSLNLQLPHTPMISWEIFSDIDCCWGAHFISGI